MKQENSVCFSMMNDFPKIMFSVVYDYLFDPEL